MEGSPPEQNLCSLDEMGKAEFPLSQNPPPRLKAELEAAAATERHWQDRMDKTTPSLELGANGEAVG